MGILRFVLVIMLLSCSGKQRCDILETVCQSDLLGANNESGRFSLVQAYLPILHIGLSPLGY